MGGVPEIIRSIASLAIGSWLVFHSAMSTLHDLYRLKAKEKIMGGCSHEHGNDDNDDEDKKNKERKNKYKSEEEIE